MTKKLENLLSIILTVCAVAVSSTFVYRQFGPHDTASGEERVYVSNWRDLIKSTTLRIGSSSAPVQIIEFGDFECPFCKQFHENFDTLMAEFPAGVSLVFLHYPLPYHKFADPAARAAECAAAQDRFAEMAKELFLNQGSFTENGWEGFARAALVSDLDRFNDCLGNDELTARIRTATELGNRIRVRGTPTIIVNGWRYPFAPPLDSLRQIVKKTMAEAPKRTALAKH